MMIGRVKIHLLSDDVDLNGFTAVSGFKGFGAVGIITVQYMVEQLGMNRVGIITTKYHPEYVFRDDNGLSYPYEIYVSKNYKIVALVNREIPDERVRLEYVWKTTQFLKEKGVEKAVLVGGLDSRYKASPDEKLRWLKNSHCKDIELQEPLFEKGLLIVGPLALQLMVGDIIGLPMLVLLPYANAETPDPAAASVAIEKINEMLGTRINTKDLMREAERIQEEISRLEELIAKETDLKTVKEPYM